MNVIIKILFTFNNIAYTLNWGENNIKNLLISLSIIPEKDVIEMFNSHAKDVTYDYFDYILNKRMIRANTGRDSYKYYIFCLLAEKYGFKDVVVDYYFDPNIIT